MPLVTRERARSLFADLTQNATVPLDPDVLLYMPRLRQHAHVFFGDIAVRCYKHKARWMYDERDVRAAGQVLADLDVDLGDVVDVELPAYRDISEREPEEWHRPGWRRTLMSWMVERARFKLVQENRPCEEWGDWRAVGGNGLPGGLTWEEFIAYSSQARHLQNIAGTRPLQLLAWNGETWLLPRAYTEFLDRWEQRESELVDRARLCRCGAQGPYFGDWRRNTRTGYVTMCPPCAGASSQLYTGHLRGVLYDAHRRRGTRADDYLCRLCKQSPAAAWGHCHEHGYVRGPLCGRCNTLEGTGHPYYFLRLEGAALHLLECRGCREQRTLPRRYHTAVVREHLEQTERHGRCPREPYARELEHTHGVRRFELECSGWHASRWTKDVTTPERAALVQAFIDAALAAREGRPSPGPATAAG